MTRSSFAPHETLNFHIVSLCPRNKNEIDSTIGSLPSRLSQRNISSDVFILIEEICSLSFDRFDEFHRSITTSTKHFRFHHRSNEHSFGLTWQICYVSLKRFLWSDTLARKVLMVREKFLSSFLSELLENVPFGRFVASRRAWRKISKTFATLLFSFRWEASGESTGD